MVLSTIWRHLVKSVKFWSSVSTNFAPCRETRRNMNICTSSLYFKHYVINLFLSKAFLFCPGLPIYIFIPVLRSTNIAKVLKLHQLTKQWHCLLSTVYVWTGCYQYNSLSNTSSEIKVMSSSLNNMFLNSHLYNWNLLTHSPSQHARESFPFFP